ncbi:hypothetical protein AB0L02_17645 [Streptomyces anulatus]|uniref:hypothetical protein n=1 Tax=Streptomyces anulatus TaxID=1892 RepID=UPI003443E555
MLIRTGSMLSASTKAVISIAFAVGNWFPRVYQPESFVQLLEKRLNMTPDLEVGRLSTEASVRSSTSVGTGVLVSW